MDTNTMRLCSLGCNLLGFVMLAVLLFRKADIDLFFATIAVVSLIGAGIWNIMWRLQEIKKQVDTSPSNDTDPEKDTGQA